MDRRDYIVSQAAELIRIKGYECTTLNDIMEAARISRGQFYHYFSSKHELGLAVIDYFFANWNHRLLEEILGKPGDPGERLDEMLKWIVVQHTRRETQCGCPFGNLAIEMSLHDELFRRKLEAVFDLWIANIAQLLEAMITSQGGTRHPAVRDCAEGIVAMIEGGILLMKSKQDIRVLINVTDMARDVAGNFVQQALRDPH